MNKSIIAVAGFVLGVAAGAAGSWYICKTKYEQIAQEEIDSVKAVFSKRLAEANEEMKKHVPFKKGDTVQFNDGSIAVVEDVDEENETITTIEAADTDGDPTIEEVKQLIDYSGYSASPEEIEKKMEQSTKPYIISREELGDYPEYDLIELTYFADEVLCDDGMEPIDNVEEIVGSEWVDHFGEYDADTVYVRNDRLKADYVVVTDPQTYEEYQLEEELSKKGVL